ncbi:hypothetical protein LXL04_007924 [Taraxacum kok-saghyz]
MKGLCILCATQTWYYHFSPLLRKKKRDPKNKPYFLRYFLPQSIDLFLLHTSDAVAAFLLHRPVQQLLLLISLQICDAVADFDLFLLHTSDAVADFDFFSLSQLQFHSDLACSTAPASDFTSNLLSYLRFHFEHSPHTDATPLSRTTAAVRDRQRCEPPSPSSGVSSGKQQQREAAANSSRFPALPEFRRGQQPSARQQLLLPTISFSVQPSVTAVTSQIFE